MSDSPVFSLILATVGRTHEVQRLLRSLSEQTVGEIELIVVDQNEDDRLKPLLADVKVHIRCIHLRSPRGLSRARNRGLEAATGTIVAFPDDDCWYGPQLLRQVMDRFDRHPEIDGWTGMTRDSEGTPSASRWSTRPGVITPNNIWRKAGSATIFLKRSATQLIGSFNESLGVGAGTVWGSGEETDYMLRGLEAGMRFQYDPTLVILHPQVDAHLNFSAIERGYAYGMGFGRVLRSHTYSFPIVLYHWTRSCVGALVAFLSGDMARARFSWNVFRGRVEGYCSNTGDRPQ